MQPLVQLKYLRRFALYRILKEIQIDNPGGRREESTPGKVDFSTL
jgi:hypothetical protein